MADLKVWGILPGGTTREQVVLDYTVTGNETDGYDIVISKKSIEEKEYDLSTLAWGDLGCSSTNNLSTATHLSFPNWKLINSAVESGIDSCANMYRNNTTIIGSSVKSDITSTVTDMKHMFYECSSLTTVPEFDTSKVTDMRYMFYNCTNLTSVPKFDTSNVTNMDNLFSKCSKLTTIPEFNTSNTTTMASIFFKCDGLTSVPKFDTSNVTNMSDMFNQCTNLVSVPKFDTNKVTSMSFMFYECSSLTTVPEFDTSKTTSMSYMFYGCSDSVLSDTSRDNILKMCTKSRVTYKHLKSGVFADYPINASKWNTLPSYNDFVNAGWSLD